MCPAGLKFGHSGPLRYLTCGQVTLYHTCIVDVRHLRTVHCVDHYPCLPDPQKISGTAECGAVHYGYCVPLMLDGENSHDSKLRHHPVTALFASPTPDKNLKALVNRFVAQDKATRVPTMIYDNGEQRSKIAMAKFGLRTAHLKGNSTEKSKIRQGPEENNDWFEIQSEENFGELMMNVKVAGPSETVRKSDNLLSTAVVGFSVNRETENRGVQHPRLEYTCDNGHDESMGRKHMSASDGPVSTKPVEEVVGIGMMTTGLQKWKSEGCSKPFGSVEKRLMDAIKGPICLNTVHDIEVIKSPVTNIIIDMSTECSNEIYQQQVDVDQRILESLKNSISVKTAKAMMDTLLQDDGCLQSPVDYAKKRFQLSQSAVASPIRTCSPINGIPHLVSETKNRFETGFIHTHDVGSKWKAEWLPNWDAQMASSPSTLVIPPTMQKSISLAQPCSNSALPRPKLTLTQKQHIRERALAPVWLAAGSSSFDTVQSHTISSSTNSLPIRPFLTKGSVAERVLIFERCPILDKGSNRIHQTYYPTKPLFNTWRTSTYDVLKPQSISDAHHIESEKEFATNPTKSSTRRPASNVKDGSLSTKDDFQESRRSGLTSGGQHLHIPKFYYPHGQPFPLKKAQAQLHTIAETFAMFAGHRATQESFGLIAKVCGLPLYWKLPLFLACRGDCEDHVTCGKFLDYWKMLLSTCYDNASMFIHILTQGQRPHLLPEDFVSLIQDVIDTHPGLTFLKEATEFHSRYVHTVIARVYYCTNRSWSGKIANAELRKSNFLQVLSILEHEEDINQVTEYFSYEHFYVIYCKFWELDKDHDLYIDKVDLRRHNDNAISSRMIERIFCGAVTHGRSQREGKMSYSEFVWFLLSEEDKRYRTSKAVILWPCKLMWKSGSEDDNINLIKKRVSIMQVSGGTKALLVGNHIGADDLKVHSHLEYCGSVWNPHAAMAAKSPDNTCPGDQSREELSLSDLKLIEYWFRCMDLDGDGFLSMYELEYFYEEQLQRMETLGIETLPFQDCLCQMLDMIQPHIPGKISLSDLKQCKMTPIFFDTFFNLDKYLDYEHRDPFVSNQDQDADSLETSDWNRYAAEEYELLVAEEGAAGQQGDLVHDDDSWEQEDDELCTNLEHLAFTEGQHTQVIFSSRGKVKTVKMTAATATGDTLNNDHDYTNYRATSDD